MDSEQKYDKNEKIETNNVLTSNETEQIKESDNVKNSYWLAYHNNFFRYDSFLFIFFTTV